MGGKGGDGILGLVLTSQTTYLPKKCILQNYSKSAQRSRLQCCRWRKRGWELSRKSFWQIIWKVHNAQWLKTKSVNSRPWLEMLHFFNALYSDSVQEWIRLLQSNREELNSDRQSFRGDGAYETETWTLCKATNLKHGLYKTQVIFFKIFSPSSPFMGHNWKSDLVWSCFILNICKLLFRIPF